MSSLLTLLVKRLFSQSTSVRGSNNNRTGLSGGVRLHILWYIFCDLTSTQAHCFWKEEKKSGFLVHSQFNKLLRTHQMRISAYLKVKLMT